MSAAAGFEASWAAFRSETPTNNQPLMRKAFHAGWDARNAVVAALPNVSGFLTGSNRSEIPNSSPVAGEVEWEYGVRYLNHPAGDAVFPASEHVAKELAEEGEGRVIAMRREVHCGPWTGVRP